MKRAALVALALLLAPAVLVQEPFAAVEPAAAQAGGGNLCFNPCQWWDPAWHMRIPVLLEPRTLDRLHGGLVNLQGERLRNYPATVEIDFTKALREADDGGFGWPKDSQGNLASFTFDRNSVRVVEYDRNSGRMLVRDGATGELRAFQTGDHLSDALLPSTFAPGLWENPGGADPLFHPERNAVGTLQWIVRGEFTSPRLFFVYFDILQNGAKAPPAYHPRDSGVLDGLHFVRWGTDIVGFAPGTQNGGAGVLMAQALRDNTTIVISKYVSEGVEPAEMVKATVNAITTQANLQAGTCPGGNYGGTVCLDVPQGDRFFFRVQANKPVLVGLRSATDDPVSPTWVPSADGGLSGTRFVFRALGTTGQSGLDIPLYLISPLGPAQVSVSAFDDGCSFGGVVDGVLAAPCTNAGNRYVITSTRPILVLQSPANNQFGLNFLSHHGAPQGTNLLGFVHNDLTILPAEGTEALLGSGCKVGCAEPLLRDRTITAVPASYFGGCGCGALGEVWGLDSPRDRLWARSGEAGIVPLGGRNGLDFRISLRPEHQPGTSIITGTNDPRETRLLLLGLYNGTRVVVTHLNGTGRPVVNDTLSLHDWVDRSPANQPMLPYGDYRIVASKPIAVYLYGPGSANIDPPFSTFYSAKVEPPLATLGRGEFHGYAVGWEEKVKTAAVGPGETVRLKLRVVNLGRGLNAQPLQDDILFGLAVTPPANASAPRLDGPEGGVSLNTVLEAAVPSFQSREVTVTAQVPATAATGAVFQLNVTATSRGNPAFTDVARVVITVQIRYEFTLRFVETNSTTIQKIIRPDTATCMDVEARNSGTGDVTVRFQMSPTKKQPAAVGFDPRLLPLVVGTCDPGTLQPLVDEDGQGLDPVLLRVRESRTLTLYVRAPADTRPLPLELEVQGTALEDASVRQQLSATVFTNVEAKVQLSALNDTRFILPRGNATFDLLIENIGDVETPVEYGITGLLPLGWSIAFDSAPPVLRGRGSVDALGRPLDRGVFTVNLTAAPAAPVAMVVPINVVATSAIIIDTGDTARAFRQSDSAKVTAVVGNNFTLEQPETLPLTINPGQPFSLAFDLRNVANGNFSLRVLQGALPRNWTLQVDSPAAPVRLEVGDLVPVRVNITPEVATKAGAYEVGLALVAQDDFTQGAQFRNLTVLVRSTVEFDIQPDATDLVLPPGGQRELGLQVTNTGNLPVALRVGALAPPGYQATLVEGSKVDLRPGEGRRLTLLLRAPQQSAEAAATLRLTGLDDTSNKQKEFPVTVRTARLDLVVESVTLLNGEPVVGQPAVVAVTVQNRGTVPANNVALALIVNGQGVRNETLRTLPPGEPRVVTLSWTVDEPLRELVVVLDQDEKYAESDESNNQARLDRAAGLPGFDAPLALAALAVALAAARARLKPPRRGGPPDG